MKVKFDDPIDNSLFLTILEYEIVGTWWAGIINVGWVNDLSSIYFARKARRKYNRWMRYHGHKSRICKK